VKLEDPAVYLKSPARDFGELNRVQCGYDSQSGGGASLETIALYEVFRLDLRSGCRSNVTC